MATTAPRNPTAAGFAEAVSVRFDRIGVGLAVLARNTGGGARRAAKVELIAQRVPGRQHLAPSGAQTPLR